MQNQKKSNTAPKGNHPLEKLLHNDRFLSMIFIIGLVGIGIIFLSSNLAPAGSGTADDREADGQQNASSASDEYRSQLTEELGNMLASIEGAGKTKIMITLKGSVREIYAADTDINGKESSKKNNNNENADKQNTEKKTYTIIRGKDGSEKALTMGQLLPEIKGVLIVCEGGDDEEVKSRITDAVSAALDIHPSHIYVTKLDL